MVDEKVKLKDVYQDVTDTVISQLEQGVIPWRKTWSQGSEEGFLPTNVTTSKNYRGWNVFWLNLHTQIKGYTSSRYITYKQAVALGGKIIPGEKGVHITYWATIIGKSKNEDEIPVIPGKTFMVPKIYTVFNIDQCEGILFPVLPVVELTTRDKIEACENIITHMPNSPMIKMTGIQPMYIPSLDTVQIPMMHNFEKAEYFYSVLFHELAHSTGHETRLNRKEVVNSSRSDTTSYANEELVAELTASFLNAITGTTATTIKLNASYIEGWLKALKNDKKLVLTAAARAQRAADYILNITAEDNTTKETQTSLELKVVTKENTIASEQSKKLLMKLIRSKIKTNTMTIVECERLNQLFN